jgi:branched-chain amino acid aminotransferase
VKVNIAGILINKGDLVFYTIIFFYMTSLSDYLSYVFFQDRFCNKNEAKIPIMTNALQYGNAIFGGIRGYFNKNKQKLYIFRLEDHYRRFLASLRILGVKIDYSLDQLKEITLRLAEKNKPKTDVYFRPFAYASSLNISPNLEQDKKFAFALYMLPLGEYLSIGKGLRVMISSWRRVSDNAIPSRAKIAGAYINSSLARGEATALGFDEAIFLTEDGHVAEGSAENLFIVRDGILVTSPKTDEILEGITRRSIIQIAKDLKIPVEERRIDRSELYVADEAFFSGTGVQVAWIAEIDGRRLGEGKRGPITAKIQDLFFQVVRGETKKYSFWRTEIDC